MTHGADGKNAGNGADTVVNVPAKEREGRRSDVEIYLRHGHVKDQSIFGIEAGIDTENARHTFKHEAGSGEDHQTERNLDGDENGAKTPAGMLRRAATFFLQRFI